MYSISDVEEVTILPKDYKESHHISQYLYANSSSPISPIVEVHTILRNYSSYIIFKINDSKVWVSREESKYFLNILPEIEDNKIICWYVAGGNIKGYELHLKYDKIW